MGKAQANQEITPQQFVELIKTYWLWIVAGAVLVGGAVGVVNYVFLPPVYEVKAVIMAKTNSPKGYLDGMIGQIGSLASLAGGSFGGGGSELREFQQMIKSREISRHVLSKDDLASRLLERAGTVEDDKFFWQANIKVQKNLTLKLDLVSLTITFRSHDAKISYDIVRGFLDSLQDFLTHNVVTQSKNAELFVRDRLTELNKTLDEAEQKLDRLKTGDRSLASHGRSIVAEVEHTKREYLRLLRVVELLSQQYELSQIESKRNDPMFLVVDPPRVPVYPIGPTKFDNTLIGIACGIILSILSICFLYRARII